jgi:hypothetical protein
VTIFNLKFTYSNKFVKIRINKKKGKNPKKIMSLKNHKTKAATTKGFAKVKSTSSTSNSTPLKVERLNKEGKFIPFLDLISLSKIKQIVKSSKSKSYSSFALPAYYISKGQEKTSLLKKKVCIDKKPLNKRGKDRARYNMAVNPGVFFHQEKDRLKTNLLLHQNEKSGSLLAMPEILYFCKYGREYNTGKQFNTLKELEDLKQAKVIKQFSNSNGMKHIAREVNMQRPQGFSKVYLKIITSILEKNLIEAIDMVEKNVYGEIKPDIKDVPKGVKIPEGKYAAEDFILMYTLEKFPEEVHRKFALLIQRVKEIKVTQRSEEGVTIQLITRLVDYIIPRHNRHTANKVFKQLVKKYIKDTKTREDEIKKGYQRVEIEEEVKTTELGQAIRKYYEKQGIKVEDKINEGKEGEEESKEGKGGEIIQECNGVRSLTPYQSKINSTNSNSSNPSNSVSSDLASLTSLSPSLVPVTSFPTSVSASNILAVSAPLLEGLHHDHLVQNLLSAKPSDFIDSRQIQEMLDSGALPSFYTLSPYSAGCPRVFSVDKDNLAYCRKELRMHVLKDLQMYDVDLLNCHAKVATSLWGDKLPLLKNALETDSLWRHYEDYFKGLELPFYKKLIKPMHHATLLGGGKNAYKKALDNYNQSAENPINTEEFQRVEKAFIKSPICSELKSLFKWFEATYKDKEVELLDGTKMKVQARDEKLYQYWLKKDKRKAERYEGNVPSVMACLLQSYEVAAMSYVIINCQQYFLGALWQHDGITIQPLYPETFEVLQQSLNDFCDKYMNGDRLEFTIEAI